jgi:hypothetical protein
MEDALTGISVRAAWHSGKRQGLRGRALWEFASEGGSKTQSMYNIEDLPGMLRSREVGAIAPFQTFAFEVMNTVRELSGRTGMYRTSQNRLLAISRWVGAMVAFNAVADKAINRKPWQLSSFIPFFGLVTGGLNAGNPWNFALPLKYSADFKRGLDDYLRHGSWKRLRSWAIQYHMLGGIQINRTLLGFEAVAEGKVTDSGGRTLFEISDADTWKVITQGPYAAGEGREWIEDLQGSKGPLYEFTGIPLSFPDTERRDPSDRGRYFPGPIPDMSVKPKPLYRFENGVVPLKLDSPIESKRFKLVKIEPGPTPTPTPTPPRYP